MLIHMLFRQGEANPKWSGGTHKSDKGYVRISTRYRRDMYAHRAAALDLLTNPISYMFTPGQGIPENIQIHHIDYNKRHNCHGNLMFLDRQIHSAISLSHRHYVLAHIEEYTEWAREENRWE